MCVSNGHEFITVPTKKKKKKKRRTSMCALSAILDSVMFTSTFNFSSGQISTNISKPSSEGYGQLYSCFCCYSFFFFFCRFQYLCVLINSWGPVNCGNVSNRGRIKSARVILPAPRWYLHICTEFYNTPPHRWNGNDTTIWEIPKWK